MLEYVSTSYKIIWDKKMYIQIFLIGVIAINN